MTGRAHAVLFGFQGKKIGAMFKALGPEEKSKYEDLAKKDKERYAREMEAYKAQQASLQKHSLALAKSPSPKLRTDSHVSSNPTSTTCSSFRNNHKLERYPGDGTTTSSGKLWLV